MRPAAWTALAALLLALVLMLAGEPPARPAVGPSSAASG